MRSSLRHSHHIRRQQITNIKPAIRLAEKRGTPLNRFITINFTQIGCAAESVSIAFSEVRERFGRWLRRGAGTGSATKTAAFVWVIENGGDQLAAHWLVHVPPQREADFRIRLTAWLQKAVPGCNPEGRDIDIKQARTPLGAGKYMMKGLDPAYGDFYRIRPVPQGVVQGKRCGFSQSLGPSSCRRERTYHTQMRQDQRAASVSRGARSANAAM